ncbi:MAG: ABC transporter ATP-binding protein [Peptostreptococcus sp.]|uniref:ABC transporter ATP-binding protein n=1 Tax=Peptostreptococcus sp. TaxID=1262 RepID=UPI002FCA6019
MILILLESVFFMLEPFLFGKVLDNIYNVSIYKYIILILLIFIMSMIIFKVKSLYLIKLTARIEKDTKINIFSHVFKIGYKDYSKIDKGKLLNNIEYDSMIISNLLNNLVGFFSTIFSVIITLVFMVYISPFLSSIVLIFIPIEFVSFIIFGGIIRKKVNILIERKDSYINFINESLNSFKTIKLFNITKKKIFNFRVKTDDIYDLAVNKSKVEINMSLLLNLLSFTSRILIILFGAKLCIKNLLTVGTLVAFNTYSEKFKSQSNELSSFNSVVQEIGVSLERVEELFNCYDIDLKKHYKQNDFYEKIDSIRINNLDFSYSDSGSDSLINNFSIQFDGGNIYRIVGHNGVGKSTLLDIISGLYSDKLTKFVINNKYNAQDIISDYRDHITYIDQFPYIYSESIYENISIYRNINLKNIKEICKEIGIDDFIESLPNKYDTILNKDTNLSGGQKQKIIIARALVEKNDVYIFDEITSNLDKENKILFFKILGKFIKNSIIIFSSHENLNLTEYNIVEIKL